MSILKLVGRVWLGVLDNGSGRVGSRNLDPCTSLCVSVNGGDKYGGGEVQQRGDSGLVKDPDQCGSTKLTTTNELLHSGTALATDHAQNGADWLVQHGDSGLVKDPVQSTKLTTSTTTNNEILHGGSGLASDHSEKGVDWLSKNQDIQGRAASFHYFRNRLSNANN